MTRTERRALNTYRADRGRRRGDPLLRLLLAVAVFTFLGSVALKLWVG